MLTKDENIVDLQFAVQYRVSSAKDYVFNVRDPDLTLRQATESAIQEIVGKRTMDFVLTEGQDAVATEVSVLVQEIVDRYRAGLSGSRSTCNVRSRLSQFRTRSHGRGESQRG